MKSDIPLMPLDISDKQKIYKEILQEYSERGKNDDEALNDINRLLKTIENLWDENWEISTQEREKLIGWEENLPNMLLWTLLISYETNKEEGKQLNRQTLIDNIKKVLFQEKSPIQQKLNNLKWTFSEKTKTVLKWFSGLKEFIARTSKNIVKPIKENSRKYLQYIQIITGLTIWWHMWNYLSMKLDQYKDKKELTSNLENGYIELTPEQQASIEKIDELINNEFIWEEVSRLSSDGTQKVGMRKRPYVDRL